MTPKEWMAKAEWEGGVLDALDYGLSSLDLDEPSGEFYEAVKELSGLWPTVCDLVARIEALGEDA